jgi:hypothetical protein
MNEVQVRTAVLEALPKQSSPLVQLAVVELIVESRDRESLGILNSMKNDPKVNSIVRERIKQGIQQLL